MKPVAVFRHTLTEGPGYFATFLHAKNIPLELIKVDQGAAVPSDPSVYSGLVFMGGPMSVNDDLPWIAPVLALILAAVQHDIPVLGHCLGGQLMAKAFGGVVTQTPVKEIGWGEVSRVDHIAAHVWFGTAPQQFSAFHWHGETFSIPAAATRISCILIGRGGDLGWARLTVPASSWTSAFSARRDSDASTAMPVTRASTLPSTTW